MSSQLNKLWIYFRSTKYWRLVDHTQPLVVPAGRLGRYPLDLGMRLDEGHYTHFDDAGLPIRFKNGTPYHNFTTVCSYALAHWDRYLLSGDIKNGLVLQQVADFILSQAVQSVENALWVYDDCKNIQPRLSAMNQGEAISVLVRAWEFTGEPRYLEGAKGCLIPFTKDIDENGVTSFLSWNPKIQWYEEYTQKPAHHVLNGMIYALWGVRDLAIITEDPTANNLLNQGINALEQALPYFDMGFWSSYSLNEPQGKHTIASMMYHNLHIVQLQALYHDTQRELFRETAERFERYSQNRLTRVWAGFLLLVRKLNKKDSF